ncbi:MAG TPA: ORF6N domain-containing protein [Arachidicoccus sp.]
MANKKEEQKVLIAERKILNRVHVIRGVKAMLDSDPAELYCVETGRLNEHVKLNPKRFPEGLHV